MAKQVTSIVAENGKEFDTIEEAEAYERFLAAKEAFRKACDNYNRELAKQFKTADGVPFTFERFGYHYVFESNYGPRILLNESFYAYHCKIHEDGTLTRDPGISAAGRLNRFEINQLYVSEKAAYQRFLELKVKHYEWAAKDIEELRSKIEKMR